ncbi:hypothetical protein Hypma_009963 [Hypsizygus marmoreus]|uniref:Uncharacterized protein n=1 Tax=Hypsizygus marmoreus TaxID=39966 RepID=A0A369JUN4_HYPMA|nr:hypothetical protein Hypma_009963 [Hypsizygus marmoreus]
MNPNANSGKQHAPPAQARKKTVTPHINQAPPVPPPIYRRREQMLVGAKKRADDGLVHCQTPIPHPVNRQKRESRTQARPPGTVEQEEKIHGNSKVGNTRSGTVVDGLG